MKKEKDSDLMGNKSILKTKLQLALGILICVLIYKHMAARNAPAEVTMDTIEAHSSASMDDGVMARRAQQQASQIMSTGDIGEIESQMSTMGLLE